MQDVEPRLVPVGQPQRRVVVVAAYAGGGDDQRVFGGMAHEPADVVEPVVVGVDRHGAVVGHLVGDEGEGVGAHVLPAQARIEVAGHEVRGVDEPQGVSVRIGLDDLVPARPSAAAGAVDDLELGAEFLFQERLQDAGALVGTATGGVGDDHLDGPLGVLSLTGGRAASGQKASGGGAGDSQPTRPQEAPAAENGGSRWWCSTFGHARSRLLGMWHTSTEAPCGKAARAAAGGAGLRRELRPRSIPAAALET
ncbi:hypothetical protein RM446_13150 [Streptomonospora sp. DSM 45055]|uniref:Uncharacterized protein n=1 Tax=Streptomonospora wellingtoniae TaxID=3075544 RepID=A0ABU2KUX8_9ACTN|nr:hypothetical protein [Streptomonospora sp. DSM 45055]MDT0303063.1 hypothetical protein [Streptomonospora sp. DSM 45055]